MKEYDTDSSWITPFDIKYYSDKNFQRIFQFYLINSPVKKLSAQARTLGDYGWTSLWNKKFYLNRQLKEESTNTRLIYSAKTYSDMTDALTKAGCLVNFGEDLSSERIAIFNNYGTQFMSAFCHIRNSLAHARFCIKEKSEADGKRTRIYVMEDGVLDGERFKISARIILREDTLLKWTELIESGERPYITAYDNI